jgi:ABC-type uncharacterized transport system substrate-binding protein
MAHLQGDAIICWQLPNSVFAEEGGLVSYEASQRDIFVRAAGYVDRILPGATTSDLPVELPIKFNLAVKFKTAKTMGLSTPPDILAIADEVIE